jgi:hypothetical protein
MPDSRKACRDVGVQDLGWTVADRWRARAEHREKPMIVAHVKMEGAGLALQGSTRLTV